jgi:hypothetical protein
MSFEAFLTGYVSCLLWAETDDLAPGGGSPLDENYDADDIAPEAKAEIERDCRAFYADHTPHRADLDAFETVFSAEQAGHDFYLTRNGHGAGFWDRGLEDVGMRLTAACKPFGTQGAYIGDDGRIYTHN